MADISGNPFKIANALLRLGPDNYEALISSAELVPTTATSSWKAINGKPYTTVGKSAWALTITFAQDWATASSLSNKLFSSEGQTLTGIVTPIAGGPGFQVEVVIVAPSIGGAADADAVSTVSLGVNGAPLVIPAGPAIPTVTGASASSGPIAGGNLVRVYGSRFTGTVSVQLGTVSASSFTVNSDTEITIVASAQAAGSKPIKVTNATGQSTTSSPYTYV